MTAPARWGGAFAAAGALHAGAAAALLAAVAPEDRPRPPEPPESRLELAVASVPQGAAREVPGAGEAVPRAEPDAAALATGAVAAARAQAVALPAGTVRPPVAPEAARLAAGAPRPAAARPLAPGGARAEPVGPPAVPAPGLRPTADAARPLAPAAEPTSARPPEGTRTDARQPAPDRLAPASAASAPARPLTPRAEPASAPAPEAVATAALRPAADRLAPAAPRAGAPLATAAPQAVPASPAPPEATRIYALRPAPDRLAPASAASAPARPLTPRAEPASAPAPEAVATAALRPAADRLAPAAPRDGAALAAAAPEADPAPAAQPPSRPVPPGIPDAARLSERAPEAERATAAAGWSAGPDAALPGATLDAVAAFLAPAPGAGEDLRDGLRARLDGVDCARVQTVFDPDTGTVELRGHVPRPEDRARLLAAVEAELKGGLPVADRLLELPRPQCSVLAGLAAAGLPQSTEQFTNPRIIGPDAHARVYAFRGGQAMTLDIGGADYGGWLTLDYFDSAGNVVHLVPSGAVPEVRLDPQEAVTFGGGGPRDVTGGRVRVEIGPPYGKDIAVALVSSEPLFAAPRPPVEPAGTYLADLARRVEALRAAHPDFKAEWVYLFVATAP